MRKPRKPTDAATKQKISQSLKGKKKGMGRGKKAAIAGAGAAALAAGGALALSRRNKTKRLAGGSDPLMLAPEKGLKMLPSAGQTSEVSKESKKKYKSFETGRNRANLMRGAGVEPKQGKSLLAKAKGGDRQAQSVARRVMKNAGRIKKAKS